MRHAFYDSEDYKGKQRLLTQKNWERGILVARYKRVIRACKRSDCGKTFEVIQSSPKVFCSRNCSATFNNKERKWSEEVKQRIGDSLRGKSSPLKGIIKIPRLEVACIRCGKIFTKERWYRKEFCSTSCAGQRRTSPKAARGKSGIRVDISPEIMFYSRWEANFARTMNLLKIKWVFQPKTFDLKTQRYTPDFYLPDFNEYVEIKNFLSDYSLNRDREFRQLYPKIKLTLILKEDYLKLQKKFSSLIQNWEFS